MTEDCTVTDVLPPEMEISGLWSSLALIAEDGGGTMLRTRMPVPVPPTLDAVMVMELVPVTVGVPEIEPVEVFTLRPEGSPDALKLVGELLAAI